ncbi:hypothetical protein [Streptomyces sp. NPDC093097]|uniref:hypothetical protein n=1 Tax=Streptomyces sp. NPDC093097 TaxID=3366027 RepID=UPI0037F471E8
MLCYVPPWRSDPVDPRAIPVDSLTGEQLAATFAYVTGVPGTRIPMSRAELRSVVTGFGRDCAARFPFLADRDLYARDRL